MYAVTCVIRHGSERYYIKPAQFFRSFLDSSVLCKHLNHLINRFEIPDGYLVEFVTIETN